MKNALFLLLLFGCGRPMINVGPSTLIAWVGDSNTASVQWMNTPGGIIDQINAQLGTTNNTVAKLRTGSSPARQGANPVLFTGRAVRSVVLAANGWETAQIDANAAQVVAVKPDLIIGQIGINDAGAGIPPATVRANMDATFAQYAAGLPGVPVAFMGAFLSGETTAAGPPRFNNGAIDAAIDAINVQIAASCVANGVEFVSTRPEALVAEIANAPPPGVPCGFFMDCATVPHVHVDAAGALFWATQVMAHLNIVP